MAHLLPTRMVEKVWGRDALPAPFSASDGQRIGEIWFEPPPELDALLVKYLFTSDKLSVQVHPNDAQAPAGSNGKEECWLVLDAEPEAKLAIGFRQDVTVEQMRAGALDGSIEHMLEWHDARPGDFFYIPAGTVHAIGPGLSLVEVQQNSDITYRFYDYGRPRDLHLEESLSVALGTPHGAEHRASLPEQGSMTLVDGPHFLLDRLDGRPDAQLLARYAAPLLVLPLAGEARLGDTRIGAGECALAPSLDAVDFSACQRALLTAPVSGPATG
ncbi:MAG: class I mannose-6-phosphate isomerase [Sphingomonadaceae bacterium]|nr:class I mannose-6-phosphate isomerase [Sphingomonadaceae bacterium]